MSEKKGSKMYDKKTCIYTNFDLDMTVNVLVAQTR